ncbi:hypothetical protein HRbin26_00531 [bacterium HR26]|nr:hypothetical protein HRbin26_00531 [bacterium HR26]
MLGLQRRSGSTGELHRSARSHGLMARVRRLLGAREPAPDRYLARTLEEELELAGCPVCRLLARKELRGLEAMLWEQVTDPLTHRRLLASRGFCFEHTWALIPAGRLVHSHYGVAIILDRLLRDFLARAGAGGVEAARQWLRPDAPCPACEWNRAAEDTLLWALAWLGERDPGLVAEGPAALCRPHAAALIEYTAAERRPALERRILARQERALREGTAEERLLLLFGRRPHELPPRGVSCPACVRTRRSLVDDGSWQRSRLHAWVAWLDAPERVGEALGWEILNLNGRLGDPAPLRAPETPVAPLCLGHLRQLLVTTGSREPLRAAIEDLERLAEALEGFIASADYRFTGELTPAQRRSWRQVVARFAGETPGVGLHDLLPGSPGSQCE